MAYIFQQTGMRKLSSRTALKEQLWAVGGTGSEWEHAGQALLSQKTRRLHFVCGFGSVNRKNKNTGVVIILILNEDN